MNTDNTIPICDIHVNKKPRACEIFWPRKVTVFNSLFLHVILCVGGGKKLTVKKGNFCGRKIRQVRSK